MNGPIESVLIPTDDSEGAIAGAKVGIALASQMDAEIHVLSVVNVPSNESELTDEGLIAELEADASNSVDRIATLANNHDTRLEVITEVKQGTPFQRIREYAQRREIDTIVMGTQGRTGIDRVLLGSVTENVLRTARVPVLTVPPAADGDVIGEVSFDGLLLPTDGSEGAEIATDWAITLASAWGSMLHSIYSVDTSRFPEQRDPGEMIAPFEARGTDVIDNVRQRAVDAGVSVSSSIATGRPATVILEYASQRAVDMIVMGTHGRTGIGQWFLGSVTENVVRQAEVPVFCVPVSASSP